MSAIEIYKNGGILAYPTEAVFGIGCDPDNEQALERLLTVKNRSANKGLILLAGEYSQLVPYIDESLISEDMRAIMLSKWPDGITQIVPKNKNISPLLSGKFNTIAIRVTSQADVVALCKELNKPVVSTSANLSGQEPAKTWQTLSSELIERVDFVIKGATLGHEKPSQIIYALTGEVVRS